MLILELTTLNENEEFEKMSRSDVESFIKQHPGERIPEFETALLQDEYPDRSNLVLYASICIQGRWPELELLIKKNPFWLAHYAVVALKQRLPEAEDVIATEGRAAGYYAYKLLDERWIKVEKLIWESDKFWDSYVTKFPDAEPERSSESNVMMYISNRVEGGYQKLLFTDLPNTMTDKEFAKLIIISFPELDKITRKTLIRNREDTETEIRGHLRRDIDNPVIIKTTWLKFIENVSDVEKYKPQYAYDYTDGPTDFD